MSFRACANRQSARICGGKNAAGKAKKPCESLVYFRIFNGDGGVFDRKDVRWVYCNVKKIRKGALPLHCRKRWESASSYLFDIGHKAICAFFLFLQLLQAFHPKTQEILGETIIPIAMEMAAVHSGIPVIPNLAPPHNKMRLEII